MKKSMLQHKQPLKLKKKTYNGEKELEIVSTLQLGATFATSFEVIGSRAQIHKFWFNNSFKV